MMCSFKSFLDALDTPGGHILLCTLLGLAGVGLVIVGHAADAKELLGFFGIAAYAMRGVKPANGQSTTTTTKETQ